MWLSQYSDNAEGCTTGIRVPAAVVMGFFVFDTVSRSALWPTQPPIQWVPWLKRPGREADHYLHLVPRLRMHGAIPPLPQYVLMALCLIKRRDNCTLCSQTLSLIIRYKVMTKHEVQADRVEKFLFRRPSCGKR
jgi:hypothetical protein